MHGQERVDAAIVGAGFAGLALACHLGEQGRAACVLERRPRIPSGGSAILLQANGLAALERLGVLEPILAAGSRIDRVSLRDLRDRELASYDYDELPHRHPFMVAIRRVDVLGILAERLADLGPDPPRPGCEFQGLIREGDRVSGLRYRDAGGREQELRSGCVVGADGARSSVRTALGIRAGRLGRPDRYVVGFGRLPATSSPNQQVIYCGHGFGNGVVPMGEQALFWDHVTEQNRAAVEAHDVEAWRALYGRRVPGGTEITDGIASWDALLVFTARVQIARRRTAEGAALAGDAAATVHPHTAQGANLALEDAIALGELLSERRSLDPITRAELEPYARRRQRKGLRYVLWSQIAAPNVDAPNAGWRAVRRAGHYTSRIPPLRRAVLRTTAGIVGDIVPKVPQRSVGVVRQALSARLHSHRAPEERLRLRIPWLFDLGSRILFQLPPRTRLRRMMLARTVCVGQAAYSRGDFEALLPLYHPDVEVHAPEEWVGLGDFDPVYRGHGGLLRFYRLWADAWADNWAEPQELIDLGDRLVLLGQIRTRGGASGIEIGRPYALLSHIRHGKVAREQVFTDAAEALESVGLPKEVSPRH